MIKAGALFYAIAISLVIAIICSSYIIFAHYNRLNNLILEQNQKLIINANSGFNLLLSNSLAFPIGEKIIIDLFSDQKDTVILERKQWGLFEVAVSRAVFKNLESLKVGMIGQHVNNENGFALYLADFEKPLSLCGNTVLSGKCFLPKAGIKRAYIEGQNFAGEKFVNGTELNSNRQLPEVNQTLIELNKKYFNNDYSATDSLVIFDKEFIADTLIHSFKDLTVLIKSKSTITLLKKVLKGNIKIISDESVFIGASAMLQDVIVYAPKITIEDGFIGSLQLIATDSIIIGKGCNLTYPSAVSLIRNNKSAHNIYCEINENTRLSGVVFAFEKQQEDIFKKISVHLEKNTLAIGEIFVVGSIDLKGKVYGDLTCNKFVLQTPSSTYENHLLNAVIDFNKLPLHFTSAAFLKEPKNKGIVKWLN